MTQPRVWIVVPILNHLELTRSCLNDLNRQVYPNIAVVLSDSGSTDGTLQVIPREFPSVIFVHGNSEWWWTKATNEGVKLALSKAGADDYIMTLNNDVEIPQNYLTEMVNLSMRYPNSVIGSVIYDAGNRDRLVACGSYINWPTMKFHSLGLGDLDGTGFSEKLAFICGKGVLYQASVFRDHGLFDERRLPHYGADHDFVALCRKLGYTLRIQTAVPLYSREDITAPGAREVKTLRGALKLFCSRKSQLNLGVHLRIMLKHCPKRYWPTSALLLAGRLLGHVFIKKGTQEGPAKSRTIPDS
jgi:GT2 family glycosyltransferase